MDYPTDGGLYLAEGKNVTGGKAHGWKVPIPSRRVKLSPSPGPNLPKGLHELRRFRVFFDGRLVFCSFCVRNLGEFCQERIDDRHENKRQEGREEEPADDGQAQRTAGSSSRPS